MVIGLDFDNTLICYDGVFREIASEYDIALTAGCSNPKRELQAEIRARPNGEVIWTEIQASAYGPRLMKATPFPGLVAKLQHWKNEGHDLCIVSHKTYYPTLGELYDLRAEASKWITQFLEPFFDLSNNIFFESTQQEKLSRIASQKCDVFIDDLPEIIDSEAFPKRCSGILFSPNNATTNGSYSAWDQIQLPKQGAVTRTPKEARRQEKDLRDLLPNSHSGSSFSQSKLPGGINSEVYLLRFTDLPDLILKQYPNDNRSRLERESHFLCYLALLPEANTPRLITSELEANRCLMTKLEGVPFNQSDTVEAEDWIECLTFIRLLQSQRESSEAKELPAAADAAFSLQSHLGITTRRRNQMATRARSKSSDVISVWILGELESAFQELARSLIANPLFKSPIGAAEKILSPSDFGLHNALLQEDRTIAFFDFEYAGWDDPAKTWSDFFLQPQFPAPKHLTASALEHVSKHMNSEQRAMLRQRLPFVFACCGLNWIYIILSHRWREAGATDDAEALKQELSTRTKEALSAIRKPMQFREITF